MSWPPAKRACAQCGTLHDEEDYSRNQWSKGIGLSRCSWCVQGCSKPCRPSSARENDSSTARVDLSNPIAEGAFRLVYKGEYKEGRRKGQPCVCKIFKTGSVWEDSYFATDIKVIEKALHLVEQWNAVKVIDKTIQVNRARVWTFSDPPREGEKNLVEPFIKNWEKFNSNSGYVNSDGRRWSEAMQALSHYSYHISSGQFVLCDLQGGIYSDGAIITDPVIISRREGQYGPTDLGPDGISNFFAYHRCNDFCSSSWTRPRDARRLFAPKLGTSMMAPMKVSTRTSRPNISAPVIHEDEYDDWSDDF